MTADGNDLGIDTTTPHIARFFDGLDLIEPGLVQPHRWRAATPEAGDGRELANYGGVARKGQ